MTLKKFFWTLSGDDVNVIEKCNTTTKKRFTAIGVLVAVIFLLCFISCFFAFTNLLQNLWIGILIGLFFAWMITNIYLFLLYTLSKTGFPYIPNKSARFISVSIRLIFIAFIAVIVSKPIESLIFSKQLQQDIEVFKINKLAKYTKTTYKFLDSEIQEYQKLLSGSDDAFYTDLIEDRKKQKHRLITSMQVLVKKSNYYIQGIVILNKKYPLCWVITLIILTMFIIPTYLKIFIHKDSIFYKTKHYIESRLVKYEYELFKEKYNTLFRLNYDLDIHFTEHFTDAPFNTKQKEDKQETLNESDLIDSLYA
jgi:ABC-type multidrug transport system fused ATPase/permease subunit